MKTREHFPVCPAVKILWFFCKGGGEEGVGGGGWGGGWFDPWSRKILIRAQCSPAKKGKKKKKKKTKEQNKYSEIDLYEGGICYERQQNQLFSR